jgi:DNA-binding NtrC family response regulator
MLNHCVNSAGDFIISTKILDAIMDATAQVRGPDEFLDFEHPVSYATHSAPFQLGGARHLESDDRDFDTFVEEQLRDGTGTLYADAMNWMERRLLVRVLAQTNGNKSKACQILGITRGSLRHKICQLGISIHQTVSVNEMDGR